MKKKIEHWKVVTLLLIIYDFLAIIMSYFLALWIRFDCEFSEIDLPYFRTYCRTILVYALFCVVVLGTLRLYKSIWRFASRTSQDNLCYSLYWSNILYRSKYIYHANACFILLFWSSDAVYFNIGHTLFLSLCSVVKRAEESGQKTEKSNDYWRRKSRANDLT